MGIYKRGDLYWYKFQWNGRLIRESTKQSNDKVARKMEAAHRTSSAQGEVGIREKTRISLAEFIKNRFEPWASSRFPADSQTWKSSYKPSIRAIQAYSSLTSRNLDAISSEHIDGFAAHLTDKGLLPASANARLRVVRSVLHKANNWGVLDKVPHIAMLKGENHRDRVLTPEEEQRYLAACKPLLRDFATILVDSALRPEENFRMRWEDVSWATGRNGAVSVTHGKTEAARRIVPLTPRARAILQAKWELAERLEEGWVWPRKTKSGHAEPSTVKKQHAKAIKLSNVRPFVLYTFIHTMLTRLGESGKIDVWTLARIAGHSSIRVSMRYVHPSDDHILSALGGHKTGYSAEINLPVEIPSLAVSASQTEA